MTTEIWPPWNVTSLERQLDSLAAAVRTPGDRPDEEQIWLTRFLVVRACGYLEQAVHEVVIGHLRSRSAGMIRSFSVSWMSRSRNPSPENLLEVVGRFDTSMQHELEQKLNADDGMVRRELSLLVHRRHHIAHGENEGLGSRKALDLVDLAKDLADWFILALRPDATTRQLRNR